MFSCGARGDLSLLGAVAAGQVMDSPEVAGNEPVMVHMTVCRNHVRAARAWLQARSPDQIDTYSTETLMREWGQVREVMEDTPIWSMMSA